MAASLTETIRAVRDVDRMPDGSPMPSSLGHALLVLATYAPHIWPSQSRLAVDMNINRRNVNKRLRALEDAGFIARCQRGERSTAYQLRMGVIRACGASSECVATDPSWCVASDKKVVSPATQEEQLSEAPIESGFTFGKYVDPMGDL